eukprot:GHRR01028188.1.p1 GENE.GHRR01028188.1~~GHRR01028188.1.p1  ORF type:complete len:150 (-),score=23.91 GHRR01028188.1:784-1233(-)
MCKQGADISIGSANTPISSYGKQAIHYRQMIKTYCTMHLHWHDAFSSEMRHMPALVHPQCERQVCAFLAVQPGMRVLWVQRGWFLQEHLSLVTVAAWQVGDVGLAHQFDTAYFISCSIPKLTTHLITTNRHAASIIFCPSCYDAYSLKP